MFIRIFVTGGAALAALGVSPALAQADGVASSYAATAINSGQFSQAERILKPESLADANDPARLINIATVYSRTQRYAEARVALQRVETLPVEYLELANGNSYSSHVLAKAMLSRLDGSR